MRDQKRLHRPPVKVLVVDDSAFMRRIIISSIEKDPEIDVVGYARNGEDALEKIKKLKPDVVTLDVEMPKLDGIETLRRLMCATPLPVVMLSAHTTEGAKQTLQALELGAVDFVAKPEGREDLISLLEELPRKLKMAASVKVERKCVFPTVTKKEFRKPKKLTLTKPIEIVAIGTSTGGPTALQKVLTKLPEDFPVGIVVVQHMPKGFTRPFADRLNELCPLKVKEAEKGDIVEKGKVLIAPAGYQMQFIKRGSQVVVDIREDSPIETRFKPSVDVMLLSLAEIYGGNTLGVIMTGMGSDGTLGLKKLKKLGAVVLAQDENTSVVYGMPRSAVEAGVVDLVLPLEEIAGEIRELVK